MPHDIGGAADHAVLAYARAAGDAGAAGDRRMCADAYVVPDLDQIVQLDSVFDHRVVQRSPVDTGVGADLYVVADHHRSGLRNLSPDALLQRNAESIGADHRARMDQRALAQATTRADSDMRMQPAGGAELDCVAEVATRADHHPPAELHAAAHIRPGADAGAGRHPRPARGNCVRPLSALLRITAPARVPASCFRYLLWLRKPICCAAALSSVPTWLIGVCASPIISPPKRSTIWARRYFLALVIGAGYFPAGLSSSALITLSVMSMRGLAYTASWKMMS